VNWNFPFILASIVVASVVPVGASPPGNIALSHSRLNSQFDLKGGFGIADPYDNNSPCTVIIYGMVVQSSAGIPFYYAVEGKNQPQYLQDVVPLSGMGRTLANTGVRAQSYMDHEATDYDVAINLKGPAVGISNLRPLLYQPPQSNPSQPHYYTAGLPLGIPCPLPGSGPGTLWLVWSGVNWHSVELSIATELDLCTQRIFSSNSPGCLPFLFLSNPFRLIGATCGDGNPTTADWGFPSFIHDYTDGKGKQFAGMPWDTLGMKNDGIFCPEFYHAHDYTSLLYYADWSPYHVAPFELIPYASLVHPGSGTGYAVICWELNYFDFSDSLNPPRLERVHAHNWKLVLDLDDFGSPLKWVDALQTHFGGHQVGDAGSGITVALRGVYSMDAGSFGENGDACPDYATYEWPKPAPLV
jgi:hypothetical protein